MEAIAKMKFRFENKENHPMYGKTHSAETLVKISKGPLNPMYGKIILQKVKIKYL